MSRDLQEHKKDGEQQLTIAQLEAIRPTLTPIGRILLDAYISNKRILDAPKNCTCPLEDRALCLGRCQYDWTKH